MQPHLSRLHPQCHCTTPATAATATLSAIRAVTPYIFTPFVHANGKAAASECQTATRLRRAQLLDRLAGRTNSTVTTILYKNKHQYLSSHKELSSRILTTLLASLTTRRHKNIGLVRELNPGPRAPEARIIPLDQRATHN